MNRKLPELLAPAGSLPILIGAVDAGADAVYFGGQAFNARRSAANFTKEEIREAVCYTAPRGVKTYLTLNILVKETEWAEACRFADECLSQGITGLIVQDLGLAAYIREHYPDVELVASTQTSLRDAAGALYAKKQGFTRLVLPREMSLKEAARIRSTTGIETEIFIHGALCYSYSGQCLMSSFVGGRSGNRGRCAQSCRLPYGLDTAEQPGYYMNLKDICLAEHMKEIAEADVASLKIEGRMKSRAYVQGVTGLYRRALAHYAATGENYVMTKDEREEIALLFNRGGFSRGYLFGKEDGMICHTSPKHAGLEAGEVVRNGKGRAIRLSRSVGAGDTLEIRTKEAPYPSFIAREAYVSGEKMPFPDSIDAEFGQEARLLVRYGLAEEIAARYPERKRPVKMEASIKEGEYPSLAIICGGVTVRVTGDSPAEASVSRPLSREEVLKQLSRLGGTPFEAEEISLDLSESVFMPVSALNRLRRLAVEELLGKLIPTEKSFSYAAEAPRDAFVPMEPEKAGRRFYASVKTAEQAEALIGNADRIYLDMENFSPEDLAALRKRSILNGYESVQWGIALPLIVRDNESCAISQSSLPKKAEAFYRAGARYALISHPGQSQFLREAGYRLLNGPGIGIMNDASRRAIMKVAQETLLSTELSAKEAAALTYRPGTAVWAYGRVPVMLTEQCPAKEAGACTRWQNRKEQPSVLIDRKGAEWPIERHCGPCYNVFYSFLPIEGARQMSRLCRIPADRWFFGFLEESGEEAAAICRRYLAGESTSGGHSGWLERGVE